MSDLHASILSSRLDCHLLFLRTRVILAYPANRLISIKTVPIPSNSRAFAESAF